MSPPAGAPETPERNLNKFLAYAGGGFLITCVVMFFLGSWLVPAVEPGYPLTDAAKANPDGTFQVTLDVHDRNHWVGLNLSTGKQVKNHANADILMRRYVMQVPGGALNLDKVALADAKLPADPQWVQDEDVDGANQNQAVSQWYDYSYMSHLLKPKGETYAVRLKTGGVAYFQIISYYCEPEGSGCMTIRYRLENT